MSPYSVPGAAVGIGDRTENQTNFPAQGKLTFQRGERDYKPNKLAKYIAGQMKISAKKRNKTGKEVFLEWKGRESEKASLQRQHLSKYLKE